MLKLSSTRLSEKLFIRLTLRLEIGFAGTGCCALPAMAKSKRKISIQPKDFNSSSFSDMVMAVLFCRNN